MLIHCLLSVSPVPCLPQGLIPWPSRSILLQADRIFVCDDRTQGLLIRLPFLRGLSTIPLGGIRFPSSCLKQHHPSLQFRQVPFIPPMAVPPVEYHSASLIQLARSLTCLLVRVRVWSWHHVVFYMPGYEISCKTCSSCLCLLSQEAGYG